MNSVMRFVIAAVLVIPGVTAPAQQLPPNVRDLGTIPGFSPNEFYTNFVLLPNRRIVLYFADSALTAYDLRAKKATRLGRGIFNLLAVSPQGDRIAWQRPSEESTGPRIWSMPIDPETGMAAGPAGIVTTFTSQEPRFSPDGKSIAFSANRGYTPGQQLPTPSSPREVFVIPSNGGPAQLLGAYTARTNLGWSPDGKWVIARSYPSDSAQWVDRLPRDSGRIERVHNVPEAEGPDGGILASDGEITFYRVSPKVNEGRDNGDIAYVTRTGVRGTVHTPVGSEWPFFVGSASSGHVSLVYYNNPATAYTVDLAGGKPRELSPPGTESRSPAWSRDGRRLSVLTGQGTHLNMTVMTADGSGSRTYPLAVDTRYGLMQWSPNGRYIAFRSRAGSIALLDLTTSKSLMLTRHPGTVDAWMWRPDGQAILSARNKFDATRPVATAQDLAIYETQLDGKERLLRDLTTEFPREVMGATFVSDKLIAVAGPDKRFLVPLDGGPVRQIPGPGRGTGGHLAYVSTDGSRVLIQEHDPRAAGVNSVRLTTSAGEAPRTLQLPFNARVGAWQRPVFVRGSDQVVFLVGEPHDTTWKIFAFSLNGGGSRQLATFTGQIASFEQFALSPDGKTLGYTVQGNNVSTTFYDLDLGPTLQRLKR